VSLVLLYAERRLLWDVENNNNIGSNQVQFSLLDDGTRTLIVLCLRMTLNPSFSRCVVSVPKQSHCDGACLVASGLSMCAHLNGEPVCAESLDELHRLDTVRSPTLTSVVFPSCGFVCDASVSPCADPLPHFFFFFRTVTSSHFCSSESVCADPVALCRLSPRR
jgi:hypothetical protein